MGNLPVIHEVTTSFQSVGDAITGDLDGAANRWTRYAEQSVIGSGVYAAVEAARGNEERAIELGKGMGRATGSALLGGGLLRNVPGFQEVATAGDSLGDMIGGGDVKAAEKRWEDYAENSVIGSGVYAAVEAGRGNTERAKELGKNMGKAILSAGVTVAAVGATIATAGAAAPLGAAVAAGTGAIVGAGVNAGATAAEQAIRGDDIKAGDVVGAALMGGVGGGIAGAIAGRAAAAADVANIAEIDAFAAQMAAGELHPNILADIQAAEAAGAAEMAAMEAALAGQTNAAAHAAQIEAGGGAIVRRGAPSSVNRSSVGSSAVSRASAVPSRASTTSSSSSYTIISTDSRVLYYEQGNGVGIQEDVFELNDGRAVRNPRFRDVWSCENPGKEVDAGAAFEAAKMDAQLKANALPSKQRPQVIAVVQDEAGNAMGSYAIRGPNNQDAFANALAKRQRSVLDRIPSNKRGCGHGNCAEQPITQNVRHIQREQIGQQDAPQLFTGKQNIITAFRSAPNARKVFDVPTPACNTCWVTNRFFGFQDGAKIAEVDAILAQMAAGELHPNIVAEIQAAEAAGAAEMAAREAAGAGQANAAAAGELHPNIVAEIQAAEAAGAAEMAAREAADAGQANAAAAGELHPNIVAEIQAAEAAGVAEMAAREAAGAGQANAAAAQIEKAGGVILLSGGALYLLAGSAVGSNAASREGSVVSHASFSSSNSKVSTHTVKAGFFEFQDGADMNAH